MDFPKECHQNSLKTFLTVHPPKQSLQFKHFFGSCLRLQTLRKAKRNPARTRRGSEGFASNFLCPGWPSQRGPTHTTLWLLPFETVERRKWRTIRRKQPAHAESKICLELQKHLTLVAQHCDPRYHAIGYNYTYRMMIYVFQGIAGYRAIPPKEGGGIAQLC